jgi:hypothetical protein
MTMVAIGRIEIDGVAIHSLDPGTTLVVNTFNSQYRLITLLDSSVVLVTGGASFPDATVVQLTGALGGGTTVRVGWIQVGYKMEMWHGNRRVTSSPVCSIVIERVPAIPAIDARPRTG